MRTVLWHLFSWCFIAGAPFLCGGLLPVFAMKMGVEGPVAIGGFFVYIVVYFWIWADYLDEGRRLL